MMAMLAHAAMMPHLVRIDVFPIKSLDGASVTQAPLLSGGALRCDRTFALVDGQNRYVNAKRTPRIHQLRAAFADDLRQVTLRHPDGDVCTAPLPYDQPADPTALAPLETWLSRFFEQPVRLQQNLTTGFPDDTDSPGPTLISTATLQEVSRWYPDLSLEQVRQRFRTSLEIDGVPPFWEDRLFSAANPVPFRLGDVQFYGINPCQRCPVPTRDPATGTALGGFQKTFSSQRQATLPPWAAKERFNHFYRLAVNTRVPASEAGKVLQVGDTLQLP